VRPRAAAVVGIGESEFSKQLGMSEVEVARVAIDAALDDAGLTLDDVDGLCLYDIESTTVGDVAAMLGLRNVSFFSTHSHGGGAYCAVVLSAAAALAAGHASTVLTFRARNRGRRSSFGKVSHEGDARGRSRPASRDSTSGRFRWCRRRCRRWRSSRAGTCSITAPPRTTWARWCAARSHAVRTPHDASRPLADHHAPCCCRVLRVPIAVSRPMAARSRPHHRRARARFASRRLTCSPASSAWVRRITIRTTGSPSPPALVAAAAGERRPGPGDVDAAMRSDHFTPMVLVALEDWGFCAPGEGGPFVEDGAIRWPAGRLPVNTHGGQLSEAFIHGYNNLTEAVRQGRGTSSCEVTHAEGVFVGAESRDA
jgi:hypothetical protein